MRGSMTPSPSRAGRSTARSLALVLGCTACGPEPLPSGDERGSGAETEITTSATATSTGGLEATTIDTTEPSPETSTGESTTAASTFDDTQEDTGATDSTSSTSTGASSNVSVRAIALPGGLDRVRLFAADPDAGVCLFVTLVQPAVAGQLPDVATPPEWALESAVINDVPAACELDNAIMFGGDPAVAGTGTIAFGAFGGGVFPCSLDIDATFDFEPTLPGVPVSYTLQVDDVPVDGC